MDLVALVTSLHPIDLSALAFRRNEISSRRVLILSAKSGTLSSRPERRVKQPPQTLPTVQLVRESSGTFRQLFVPLESIDGRIDHVSQSITFKYPEHAHQRQLRAVDSVAQRPVRDRLQTLLREALSTLWPGDLLIVDAARYLASETGQAATRRGLDQIVRANEAQKSTTPLKFERGGYIEIDGRHRITSGPPNAITAALNESRTVRLGGPLELLYLNSLGEPIHLPWYCQTVTRRNDNVPPEPGHVTVREYISPISCASSARSWQPTLPNSLRLNPTGYTLIDYEDVAVTEFLHLVVGQPANPTDLEDWRSLTTRYPRSDQKALKDQVPVVQFVAIQIAQWRREFTAGSSPTSRFLGLISPCTKMPPVYMLGALSCEVIAALRVLESLKHQPRLAGRLDSALQALQPTGFGAGEAGVHSLFNERVTGLAAAMLRWQQAVAPDEDQIDDRQDSSIVADVASRLNDAKVEQPEPQNGDDRLPNVTSLGGLAKQLEAQTRVYYQLVVALLNGPLKANAWNLFSLLGHDASEVCEALAQQRPDPYLDLKARLW